MVGDKRGGNRALVRCLRNDFTDGARTGIRVYPNLHDFTPLLNDLLSHLNRMRREALLRLHRCCNAGYRAWRDACVVLSTAPLPKKPHHQKGISINKYKKRPVAYRIDREKRTGNTKDENW